MASMFPHSSSKLRDVQSRIQTLFLVCDICSLRSREGSVCKALAVKAKRPESDPQNLCQGQAWQYTSVRLVRKQAGPRGLLASQPSKSSKF